MTYQDSRQAEIANRVTAFIFTLLYVPLAFAFLVPQILTWKGLLLSPFFLLSLIALGKMIPLPPDMYGSNGPKAWFRVVAVTFVTWLIFVTITHLGDIHSWRYWTDLVLLRGNVPRGGRDTFATISAILAGLMSFPPLVRLAAPAAEYLEEFIPSERLFKTADDARRKAAELLGPSNE